jgi:IS30 family transposase
LVEPRLRAVVEAKLALRWSPQQIAGWLPLAYPQDPVMRVSHETIYLSLFVQSRGALRRELQRCLRTGRAMRYPRAKRLPQGRGQLRDVVLISERPAEAEDRAVPGHWEGDLLLGKRPSAVVTLVERASRYLMLVPLPQGYKLSRSAPPSLPPLLDCPSSSGGR